MNSDEINKELQMTYYELCKYLQIKYGIPKMDYFANEKCLTKSKKITRTSEGLFCHHIYEDRYGNIGEPHLAKLRPFDCQKKENLVYCNYLEHFVLHLKINVNTKSEFKYPLDFTHFFNSLGFFWIANEINDLFYNNGSTQEWRNSCYSVIKDNFEDYARIIRGAFCYLLENYTGAEQYEIKEGLVLPFQVLDMSKDVHKDEIRGHKYNYSTIYLMIKSISKIDDTAMVQIDNFICHPSLIQIKLKYSDKIEPNKNLTGSWLVSYRLSNLKNIYDVNCVLNEYKDILCTMTNEEIFEKLKSIVSKPFSESDFLFSKWIEASRIQNG